MGDLYLVFSGAFLVAVFYLWIAIRVIRNHKRIKQELGASYDQVYEKPSGLEIILCILFPLIFIGPVVYLFIVCFYDSGEGIFLFLAAIGIILYLSLVLGFLSPRKKDGHTIATRPNGNTNSDLDLSTKLMLGAMGAKVLDKQIEKHKKNNEKQRYDSLFWQESTRDKNPNHGFDYDHEDDWLGS